MAEGAENNPSGLTKRDTLADAFARADWAATPDGRIYSGVMLGNKDLRRVVLLVREVRSLLAERDRYKAALERIVKADWAGKCEGGYSVGHVAMTALAEEVRG